MTQRLSITVVFLLSVSLFLCGCGGDQKKPTHVKQPSSQAPLSYSTPSAVVSLVDKPPQQVPSEVTALETFLSTFQEPNFSKPSDRNHPDKNPENDNSREYSILPFGSRVNKEKLSEILKRSSVEEILNKISLDPNLQLISINKKAGSLTPKTVPTDYFDTTGEFTKYFVEREKILGFNLLGLHILKNTEEWAQDHDYLIFVQDVLPQTLIHEYLHYLITSESSNTLYSPFHARELTRRELVHECDKFFTSYDLYVQTFKEDLEKTLCDPAIEYQHLRLKTYYEVYFSLLMISIMREEIEIEKFFIDVSPTYTLPLYEIYFSYARMHYYARKIFFQAISQNRLKEIFKLLDAVQLHPLHKVSSKNDVFEKLRFDFQEFFNQTDKNLKPILFELQSWYVHYFGENDEFGLKCLGDINYDERTDDLDLNIIRSILLNQPLPKDFSVEMESRCDVDGDNTVSIQDLSWIATIMQLNSSFRMKDMWGNVIHQAQGLGYEIELEKGVELISAEVLNYDLPAYCHPVFALLLVLLDQRSHNKTFSKIIISHKFEVDEAHHVLYISFQKGHSADANCKRIGQFIFSQPSKQDE